MQKKNSIEEAKKYAPELPTDTCPYIDFVLTIISEVKDLCDSNQVGAKLDLVENHMEYIRLSNETLRDSSNYWYQKFKTSINKK